MFTLENNLPKTLTIDPSMKDYLSVRYEEKKKSPINWSLVGSSDEYLS